MIARARSCSLPLTRSRNGVPTSTCLLCSSAISSERSRSSGCLSEISLILSLRRAFFCRNSSSVMAASPSPRFASLAGKAPAQEVRAWATSAILGRGPRNGARLNHNRALVTLFLGAPARWPRDDCGGSSGESSGVSRKIGPPLKDLR